MSYFGCGDGGCVLGKPKGMQTNGGCNCLKGLSTEQKIRVIGFLEAQANEIKKLKALCAERPALYSWCDEEPPRRKPSADLPVTVRGESKQ